MPDDLKPFSKNIIFFDTEFSDLDPVTGKIISIGMIKNDGEELYLEMRPPEDSHEWVKKNVIPNLSGDFISEEEAREKLWEFIGKENKEKPYLLSFVNQFDAIFWYKLFSSPKHHPAFWIPLDFASVLFARGFDPNSLNDELFLENLGIKKSAYLPHHALHDARFLRDIYNKFWRYA